MIKHRTHRLWNQRSSFYVVMLLVMISCSIRLSLFTDRSDGVAAAWTSPSTTTYSRMTSNHKYTTQCDGGKPRRRLLLRSTPSSSSSPLPLPTPFVPSSSCNVDQLSGTDLAYIGDVVYELFIRTRTVWPLKRTSDLQQQVVALVRGKMMAFVGPCDIDLRFVDGHDR
jgi:hypothetical protein